MTQFLIVHLGGEPPASPEEGKEHQANYMKWLSSLGDRAVSPANPIKDTHSVQSDGAVTEGSSIAMSGYTIIDAASIADAVDIAKSCPFLHIGGTIEVSELIEMPN